jgi:hypothetical protein
MSTCTAVPPHSLLVGWVCCATVRREGGDRLRLGCSRECSVQCPTHSFGANPHSHAHTPSLSRTRTHPLTRTCIHTHTHTHIRAHRYHTHARSHSLSHSLTHSSTHTHAHAHHAILRGRWHGQSTTTCSAKSSPSSVKSKTVRLFLLLVYVRVWRVWRVSCTATPCAWSDGERHHYLPSPSPPSPPPPHGFLFGYPRRRDAL